MGFMGIWAMAAPAEALTERPDMGFDNIWDNDGLGIAITGLSIVFVALTLISIFIALLPRVLETFAFLLPAEHPTHAPVVRRTADNEKIAVAVGFVLHEMNSKQS